jgi:glycerophosphoryl diester phosphodiesterase
MLTMMAALPAASLPRASFAANTFPSDLRLIAHRGGVVDAQHPENSPASLEAAIERGYWMLEVDVRRTRDGRAILQHDPDFGRYYGDPRKVAQMDWAEIRQLRAAPGGARPMAFEELAERCKGRIRLMLDVKEEPHPDAFYRSIEAALVGNDLLDSTYILSDVQTEAFFRGRIKQAAGIAALDAAVARGEPVSDLYFLFDGSEKITRDVVDRARGRGVDVIGATNLWGYRGGDAMARARRDLKAGYDAGVRAFQIDSAFDPFFRAGLAN